MLAAKSCDDYKFPLLASPKLDGIRCLIVNGVAVGRSLKPIPNGYVQRLFGRAEFDGFDGELIVGETFGEGVFQRTSSGVMSVDGTPDVTYNVFDTWALFDMPFSERLAFVKQHVGERCNVVPQVEVTTVEQINELTDAYIEQGYEGLMLRRPNSPYKFGRSTPKEGYLTKVKRFDDGEAEVIGVVELMHNNNEAVTNLLGNIERSTAKAGKVAAGVLGSMVVKDIKSGVEFEIGSGFTAEQRESYWRSGIVGKIVKYKSQLHGAKDKPRFPVFLGFRDAVDL